MPTVEEMERRVRRYREEIASQLQRLLAEGVLAPGMTVTEAAEALRNAPVT